MNHNLEVTGTITINATPEKIWKGLTDPAIIKDYLFGTNTDTDWVVGHPIVFTGEWEGTTYRDHGVIKQIVPNELISYSYWSGFSGTEDKPENYSLVTYKIEPIDANSCKFSWIQKGYATNEGYEHSKTGMDDFMKLIKSTIEAA